MDSIAMPAGMGGDEATGQSANAQLLRLVARANANVAELMRLSDFVPKIFYLEGADARLYGLILQDYSYFQKADLVEEKLTVDPVSARSTDRRRAAQPHPPTRAPRSRRLCCCGQDLADRDEEMKAQYGDILQRFYNLFDSIYRYVQDFLQVRAALPSAPPALLAR